MRRRPLLVGAIAILAAVAIAVPAFALLGGSDGSEGSDGSTGGGALATVRQGALTSQVYANGTLGYEAQPDGSAYAVVNQASGLFTALPDNGEVVGCGRILYRVDEDPVLLLCGRIPAYRSLYEGMEGPDVRVLNRNLVQLGYASEEEIDPESDEFGSAAAYALEELQEAAGLEETGSLELGEAVVLPGPLRLTGTSVALGTTAQPGSTIASATSTRRRVEVDLEAAQGGDVEVGDKARVTLPGNRSTAGVVSRIGAVASAEEEPEAGGESESSAATLPVYIRLEHPRDLGKLDQAPVQVEITTGKVKDALSVPVTAVQAKAGGGYAVEVVDGQGAHRLVAVDVGMSDQASGLVAVEGKGLAAGDRVVVPAS